MAIFLIRHAQSEANINKRTKTHADIVLSEQGWQQAQDLPDRLPHIQQLMISKYIRTLQTAQFIAQRDDVTPEVNEHLHEFSYLSAQKCENTNMQERKAWVDAYWHRMDYRYKDGIDAESFEQFYDRVEAFRLQLVDLAQTKPNDHIAVISHGQFLQLFQILHDNPQSISKALMQQFREKMLKQPIQNTEIFIL